MATALLDGPLSALRFDGDGISGDHPKAWRGDLRSRAARRVLAAPGVLNGWSQRGHSQKGDTAEREIAALLSDELGLRVRRKLGAGRLDDRGDLDGVPGFTLEVKNRPNDLARAVREGLADAQREQANAGTTFGAALIRRPGGRWFVAMSVPQFCAVVRETLP